MADKLGVPDDVDVVHGDTGKLDFGLGTYGSRSLAVGGSALVNAADKVIEKGRKVAAHLRTDPDNIEFEAPVYRMKNSNKSKRFRKLRSRLTLITTIPMILSLD